MFTAKRAMDSNDHNNGLMLPPAPPPLPLLLLLLLRLPPSLGRAAQRLMGFDDTSGTGAQRRHRAVE